MELFSTRYYKFIVKLKKKLSLLYHNHTITNYKNFTYLKILDDTFQIIMPLKWPQVYLMPTFFEGSRFTWYIPGFPCFDWCACGICGFCLLLVVTKDAFQNRTVCLNIFQEGLSRKKKRAFSHNYNCINKTLKFYGIKSKNIGLWKAWLSAGVDAL